jgi:CRP-like cAMP-binding protein
MTLLLVQPELQQHLIEAGSRQRYRRKDFLFHRGDPVGGVFLILSGEVRLGLDKNPAQLSLSRLWPGHRSRNARNPL